MSKVAIIQPGPGIGDMVWHLPHIHAIADYVDEKVLLVTKSRTVADQLFSHDRAVEEIIWLDLVKARRRALQGRWAAHLEMVNTLRSKNFRRVYILSHSKTLAHMAWMAGIPERLGYGIGGQRIFLNHGDFLTARTMRWTPFERASAWLQLLGIPISESAPRIKTDPSRGKLARERVGVDGNAFVAVGVGSSEPFKQWGARNFAALIEQLSGAGWDHVVLIGGAGESALVTEIASLTKHKFSTVLGWHLGDVAALCAESAFFVGNDTGVMNIAAAAGAPTFALFGATPPLAHAPNITPIIPSRGISKLDGMAQIQPSDVLKAIDEHLRIEGPVGW